MYPTIGRFSYLSFMKEMKISFFCVLSLLISILVNAQEEEEIFQNAPI